MSQKSDHAVRAVLGLVRKLNSLLPKILVLLFLLLGCTPIIGNQPPQPEQPSATYTATEEPIPTSTPAITHAALPAATGPFLLIESNFDQYQIIEINTNDVFSFDPPGSSNKINLSRNRSPSKQYMYFPDDGNQIILTDLITGQIMDTYSLTTADSEFDLEIAVQQARSPQNSDQQSNQDLSLMIDAAYQESIIDLSWYKSDQYLLVPRDSSPTSTGLTLFDLQSKTYQILENQPGLVLDYHVGPDADQILIEKGFSDEPGINQPIRYYVLTVSSQEINEIPLPGTTDNPTLFWLTSDSIGIVHQMAPVGGVDFSIYNLNSGEMKEIIKGTFTHISLYNDNILTLVDDQDKNKTTVTLTNGKGEVLQQQDLDQRCFYKTRLNYSIVLNCENNSLLLNEFLEITPFDDLVTLLAPASKSEDAILITRNEGTYRLNRGSLERQLIDVQGTPLEVRWLPDGSGFLYRVRGKLYLYNLDSRESRLLLESDILSDYANINAIWINP